MENIRPLRNLHETCTGQILWLGPIQPAKPGKASPASCSSNPALCSSSHAHHMNYKFNLISFFSLQQFTYNTSKVKGDQISKMKNWDTCRKNRRHRPSKINEWNCNIIMEQHKKRSTSSTHMTTITLTVSHLPKFCVI